MGDISFVNFHFIDWRVFKLKSLKAGCLSHYMLSQTYNATGFATFFCWGEARLSQGGVVVGYTFFQENKSQLQTYLDIFLSKTQDSSTRYSM